MHRASAARAAGADTKQRILDVAARQFREHGYAGVSLRAIAAEAGVQAASLYYHFASKEAIVVAVLDIGIEMVREAVTEAIDALPADATGADLVRTAIRCHLQTFLAYSDYTSANVRIFGQVPPAVRASNLPARRLYEGLWDRILLGARDRGALRADLDLTVARLFAIGALNATLEWFDPRRGTIDDLADAYGELILGGLLARDEASA